MCHICHFFACRTVCGPVLDRDYAGQRRYLVIMKNELTPDGAKIKSLRKALPGDQQLQKIFCTKLDGIKERKLREIENKNCPISPKQAQGLAGALGVNVNEILITQAPAEQDGYIQCVLKKCVSAIEILGQLRNLVGQCRARVDVDINTKQAALIEECLFLVQQIARRPIVGEYESCEYSVPEIERDTFSDRRFPEIYRMGRLNEVLQELHSYGVGVFVGNYTRRQEHSQKLPKWRLEAIGPALVNQSLIVFGPAERETMAVKEIVSIVRSGKGWVTRSTEFDGPTWVPWPRPDECLDPEEEARWDETFQVPV